MQHISREDLQALIAAGTVALVKALPEPHYAAAFTRLGYPDVRVYPGGKADWADVGLPFQGTRAIPRAA